MCRKPKPRLSFFKVLIKDYTSRLTLPLAFVKKNGNVLPENAKLRISSGEAWKVKLEEIDDEKYCFTRGWTKFANDMELKTGEFLVFWFNSGRSTFDVSVFGISGCERTLSDKNLPPGEGSDHDKVNENESWAVIPETRMHPVRFEVVLHESQKSRVCIGKEFAEAAGLIGKKAVVLEYPPKEQYWGIVLDDRSRSYFRIDMAGGWHDFCTENGLVLGKTYSFEFNPTKNVIQVKEQN